METIHNDTFVSINKSNRYKHLFQTNKEIQSKQKKKILKLTYILSYNQILMRNSFRSTNMGM